MNRTDRTGPARIAAALVLAAAAGLAGCASTIAGSGTPALGATAGDPTPSGTPTAGGDSTPVPTSPAPTSPAPTASAGGDVVRFGSVTVPVPAGSSAKVQGDFLCLTLQNATGCSLEVLDVGRVRAAGGSVSTPAPGEPTGWWWGSDVPTCGDGATTSPVARSTAVRKGFQRVGPKTAAYGSWAVSCQDPDLDFTPRLWWLPTSQIAFRQRSTVAGSGEAVDRILAGVTFP